MAKLSPTKKAEFAEKSEPLKSKIEEFTKKIQEIQKTINKDAALSNYKRVIIANHQMNIITYYLQLSNLSLEVLGIRNETYLENARKLCYTFMSVLEQIVGNFIDVPFNEIKDQLDTISQLDDVKRLNLVKKINSTVTLVEEAFFGPTSKWKWSFVDLDARASALCKNLLNLEEFKKIKIHVLLDFQNEMNY